MKNKDIIKLFGHSIMIEYSATGQTKSISVVPLNAQVRFAVEGDTICVRCSGDKDLSLIERFASPELTKNAFEHLQAIVKRYVIIRRLRNASARLMLWGVAPVVTLALALSANLAVTRGMEARASTGVAMANVMPPSAPDLAPEARPAAEIAKAMRDAVRSGEYSVPISSGKKDILYVFSDPSCSYCKSLEAELDKLSHTYTIELFPVSVVGGVRSAERVSSVMCQSRANRRTAWKKIFTTGSVADTACRDGDDAISTNDLIFTEMRLRGTPAIIRADGQVLPDSIPNTAAAISKWIDKSGR